MSKYRLEVDHDYHYSIIYDIKVIHKETSEKVFSYDPDGNSYLSRHLCEPEIVDKLSKAGDWGYLPRTTIVDVLESIRGSIKYSTFRDEHPDLREAFKEQLARIEAAIHHQKYGDEEEES